MKMTNEYRKELRGVRARRKRLVKQYDAMPAQTDRVVTRISVQADKEIARILKHTKREIDEIERKARREFTRLGREIRKLERRELILEGRISK